ncbi:hypothetical protein K5D53_01405 [Pseudomonas cichorii]|uniref:DUF5677 domain-containing protein n=1 Tax=Pseudomonas cichorii TaxID=36746 RepID=UPI001C88CCC9|nr:DUF5677 domain-containing protein [Pseudomonas cichorii]MBX8529133.1 hypothetical protein [Pseudomonas cichorii]MBX8543284.1 hypothetical protein [Pseudomonas cichorii]
MYSDELITEQRLLSEKALFLLRDLLPLMTPVAKYEHWTKEEQQTLGMLLTASARSSESTLLLASYGQLWDAELTLRSVCEASIKFCYIVQNHENFKSRHTEYSNEQFWAGLLKDERKIKDLLEVLDNPNDQHWKPLTDRLFTETEREEIKSKFDYKNQRALDGRWGFTGMIREFQKNSDPILKNLIGLAHSYSVASHIQHADYQGVSIPMDRDARSVERKISAHSVHLNRLISDTLHLFIIRLIGGYRFIKHPPTDIIYAQEKISELFKSFGNTYDNWINIEYQKN